MGEFDYSELEDDQFLSLVGRLVGREAWPDAVVVPSRRQPVERLRAWLAAPAAGRPLLVVGESGVGKSAIVGHALRELPEDDDWAVLWSAASEVIAGAIYIGQLEQRVQELVHRIRHRDVVWVVPRFEETLYAGQYHGHPRGLLDALVPHLETGGIRLIGEIDPAAYEQLVQRRPKVVELFEVIRLPAMPADEALAIGAAWAAERHIEIDEATLREAADFAEHYLPGLAAPGNLLRLLDMSGQRAAREGASAVTPTLVIEALASATAMPLELLDPRKPIDVDALRETLAARVLGQPEAVDCLVERIALLKAGLTDPGRPLGVFLFVGPTGTGKTELAKALAESMFGSETRLVRLDMSEFQTPESLERLLAESAGPDAPSAGLVSALRQQPFSVVLLDEFEKAHANVWDVFLQVFDDGRLTDNAGRVVDFRHAVIILTSNVGSAVSTAPALGFVGERAPFAREGVERAVSQVFRPEFLNRLDRVVVFRPLERSLMRDLVVKELRQMIERRGFRARPWTVEWDDAAIDFLVDRGFSAELGARPLRRAIEQELLAPLALEVVGHRAPAATSSSSSPQTGGGACASASSTPTPTIPSTRPRPTSQATGRLRGSRCGRSGRAPRRRSWWPRSSASPLPSRTGARRRATSSRRCATPTSGRRPTASRRSRGSSTSTASRRRRARRNGSRSGLRRGPAATPGRRAISSGSSPAGSTC